MTHADITPLGFSELMQYQPDFGTDEGKFIRIGQLVIVAPYVSDQERPIQHRDLYRAARDRPDLSDLLKAALEVGDGIESTLTDRITGTATDLHDAGHFKLTLLAEAGAPHDNLRAQLSVLVRGRSAIYVRADADGRKRTGQIFQEILGKNAIVTAVTN